MRAKRVAVCTGGYTGPGLKALLRNKIMPILSSSLVRRPLTAAELQATNFRPQTFLTDTRTRRFHYRLLKDNGLPIGSRSAVSGADAERAVHLQLLTDAIARKFPRLAGIPINYSWWGWVDVSHDMMPRITRPEPALTVWYALGYARNGVSFSPWAGKRLAERVAGIYAGLKVFKLPSHNSPLGSIRTCLGPCGRRYGHHFGALASACCTSGTGFAMRSCEAGTGVERAVLPKRQTRAPGCW